LRRPDIHANLEEKEEMEDGAETVVASLGTHAVRMQITNRRRCTRPNFAIRTTGDALVHVTLVEDAPSEEWSGQFRLPQNGTYGLEVRWYGCDGASSISTSSPYTTLNDPIVFAAVRDGQTNPLHDEEQQETTTRTPPLFAETAAWIRTGSVPQYDKLAKELKLSSSSLPPLPRYLWRNVRSNPMAGNLLRTSTPRNGSYVSTEGTLTHPDDYYKFADLSNYELVWYV
jgi:hypothetical protein